MPHSTYKILVLPTHISVFNTTKSILQPFAFQPGNHKKFKGLYTSYTLCSILDVSKKEALTGTSECCVSYSVAGGTVNIKEFPHEMTFTGMDGCFGLKTVNDFWGFPSQQDKIKSILQLTHKVTGEEFSDFEKADIHRV